METARDVSLKSGNGCEAVEPVATMSRMEATNRGRRRTRPTGVRLGLTAAKETERSSSSENVLTPCISQGPS